MESDEWRAYELQQELARLTETAAAAIARRDALAATLADLGIPAT